jgi:hypothetical protein
VKKPQLRVTKADIAWLFLASLMVVLQFWWLPGDGGNTADSFSNTMEGSRGLFETLSVLSDDGFLPPVRREKTQLVPDKPCTLLVLAPDRYPDNYEEERLRDFVQRGGTVIFATNWATPGFGHEEVRSQPLRYRLRWEHSDGYVSTPPPATGPTATPATTPEDAPLQAEAPDADDEDSETTVAETPPMSAADFPEPVIIDASSTLVDGNIQWRSTAIISNSPANSEKLVVDEGDNTQVAAWKIGQGTFVLCATADPFSNRSMLFDKQAEFAVRLVEFACKRTSDGLDGTEIVISEYLNGAGSYTGASVMISPLLRSGTLQLILVAVLLAWAGFHRFGPPLRDHQEWRRSLAQSAQAVGNLQFMANDGRTSVRQYFEWFSGEMRRRSGLPHLLDDTTQLARRTGLDKEQIEQSLADAHLRSSQKTVAPGAAAAVIRRLARIHQKMFVSGQTSASDS